MIREPAGKCLLHHTMTWNLSGSTFRDAPDIPNNGTKCFVWTDSGKLLHFFVAVPYGKFCRKLPETEVRQKKSGSNISSIIWWMKSYEQRSWRISTWSHAVEGIPEPPPKIGTTNRVEIRYPWNVAPLSRWSSLVLSHMISLSLVVHLREIPHSPSPNSRDSISTKIYLSSKSLACEVASRDNYHIDKSLSCKTVAFSSSPLAIAVGGRLTADTCFTPFAWMGRPMRSPTESTSVGRVGNWKGKWWIRWGDKSGGEINRKILNLLSIKKLFSWLLNEPDFES